MKKKIVENFYALFIVVKALLSCKLVYVKITVIFELFSIFFLNLRWPVVISMFKKKTEELYIEWNFFLHKMDIIA